MTIRFTRQPLDPNKLIDSRRGNPVVKYLIDSDDFIELSHELFQVNISKEPLLQVFQLFPTVNPLKARVIQAFDGQLDFIRSVYKIHPGTRMQVTLFQPTTNLKIGTDFIRNLKGRDVLKAVKESLNNDVRFEIIGATFYVRLKY